MIKYYDHYEQAKPILKEYSRLSSLGKLNERVELLNDSIKKYPDNICIKNKIMEIYFQLYVDNPDNLEYLNIVENTAKELKQNEVYKYNAIQTLAYLYRRLNRQDEIKDDVYDLPSVYQSKEFLMPEVLKWEERIKAVQNNFTLLLDLFDNLLLSTFGREEVGKRDLVLIKEKAFIDIIFENGDYGIYNHNLQHIYYRCARDQAYVKNKDKVLEYLSKSSKYCLAYCDFRYETKTLKHTSFLVDRLTETVDDYAFSNEYTLKDIFKDQLEDELFDFVREEEKFKEIMNELNK